MATDWHPDEKRLHRLIVIAMIFVLAASAVALVWNQVPLFSSISLPSILGSAIKSVDSLVPQESQGESGAGSIIVPIGGDGLGCGTCIDGGICCQVLPNQFECRAPNGECSNDSQCSDNNPGTFDYCLNPGDCSSRCVHSLCFDRDRDFYGDGTSNNAECPNAGIDCNDNDPAVHPGATDTCGDSIDQDCSGTAFTCEIGTACDTGTNSCIAIECASDSQCDDSDSQTNDYCANAGTAQSYCWHNANLCGGPAIAGSGTNGQFFDLKIGKIAESTKQSNQKTNQSIATEKKQFDSLAVPILSPGSNPANLNSQTDSLPVRYILYLNDEKFESKIKSELQKTENELKTTMGNAKITVLGSFAQFKMTVVSASPKVMQQFQTNQSKQQNPVLVSVDHVYQTALSDAIPITQAPLAWQDNSQHTYFRGDGQVIAIADTGIDYSHPQLGGCFGSNCKVIGGHDFVNDDSNPQDDQGHGTLMAGIMAADCPNNGVFWNGQCVNDSTAKLGVAPKAKILAYKTFNEFGSGYESAIIAAIQAALDPNNDGNPCDHASVFNLSANQDNYYYPYYFSQVDPIGLAISNATTNGMVVVTPAGNYGTQIYANSQDAIVVGGTFKKDLGSGASTADVSPSSSYGPLLQRNFSPYPTPPYYQHTGPTSLAFVKPDVVAPGFEYICSTNAPTGTHVACPAEDNPGANNYAQLQNGTSASAGFVSGAVTLVRQANYKLEPEGIRSIIRNTATPLAGYEPNEQGWGRLDIKKATEWANDQLTHTFPTPSFNQLPAIQMNPLTLRSKGILSFTGKVVNPSDYPNQFHFSARKEGNPAWSPIGPVIVPDQTQGNFSSVPFDTTTYSNNEFAFQDGKYYFKVEYGSPESKIVSDMVHTEIDNTYFSRPQNNDMENANQPFPIFGNVPAPNGNTDYAITWRIVDTGNWSAVGITKTVGTGNAERQLATFDPVIAGVQNKTIELKLERLANGDAEIIWVYLDSTLRDGFPIRIDDSLQNGVQKDFYPYYSGIPPVIADLDNDGKNDILAFQEFSNNTDYPWNGGSNLVIFNDTGNWVASVPIETYYRNSITGLTIVKDPASNRNVALVSGYNGGISKIEKAGSEWQKTQLFNGFNVTEPVAQDLDGDGIPEIIFAAGANQYHYATNPNCLDAIQLPDPSGGYNCYWGKLYVKDLQGNDLPGWPKNINVTTSYYNNRIAIGNFDSDNQIEIAVVGPKETFWDSTALDGTCDYCFLGDTALRVYVFNLDGTFVSGFPKEINEVQDWPYSVATGDLDNDGKQEILFKSVSNPSGITKVHALRFDGTELAGWPFVSSNSTYGSFGPPVIVKNPTRVILQAQERNSGNYNTGILVLNPNGTVARSPTTQANYPTAQPTIIGNGYQRGIFPTFNCFFVIGGSIPCMSINDTSLGGPVPVGQPTLNSKMEPYGFESLTAGNLNNESVATVFFNQSNPQLTSQFNEPKYRTKIFAWKSPHSITENAWPKFQHDNQNTGCADCKTPVQYAWQFQNEAGETVAAFTTTGDLILKGTYHGSQAVMTPPDGSFIVQNTQGQLVAYISPTGGYYTSSGIIFADNQPACNPPGAAAILIRNLNNTIIDYIYSDGSVCRTGRLIENSQP